MIPLGHTSFSWNDSSSSSSELIPLGHTKYSWTNKVVTNNVSKHEEEITANDMTTNTEYDPIDVFKDGHISYINLDRRVDRKEGK